MPNKIPEKQDKRGEAEPSGIGYVILFGLPYLGSSQKIKGIPHCQLTLLKEQRDADKRR